MDGASRLLAAILSVSACRVAEPLVNVALLRRTSCPAGIRALSAFSRGTPPLPQQQPTIDVVERPVAGYLPPLGHLSLNTPLQIKNTFADICLPG